MTRNVVKTQTIKVLDEVSGSIVTFQKEDETDLYNQVTLTTSDKHTIKVKTKYPVALSEIAESIDTLKKMVNMETLE